MDSVWLRGSFSLLVLYLSTSCTRFGYEIFLDTQDEPSVTSAVDSDSSAPTPMGDPEPLAEESSESVVGDNLGSGSSKPELAPEADADAAPEPDEPPIVEPSAGGNCSDGVLNGDETGVDCGGACGSCDEGPSCFTHSDCVTGYCELTRSVCSQMPTDVIAAGQYTMVPLSSDNTYLDNRIDFDSSRGYGDNWDKSGFIWDVRFGGSFRAFPSSGLRVAGSQPVGKEECLLPCQS